MRVRVRDVMSQQVVTIRPDNSLKEAAVLMADHGVSGLPVMDDGSLVGIVTESDFVARLARSGEVGLMSLLLRRDRDDPSGTVGEAMTSDVITIGPEDGVTAAARLMADKAVKRLPVVSAEKALVGIVSRADLMGIFARPDHSIQAEIMDDGVAGLVGAGADAVRVSVSDGVVRLEGTVDTVTEKKMLEEFARRVAGVVRVDNQLDPSFDDTKLPPL